MLIVNAFHTGSAKFIVRIVSGETEVVSFNETGKVLGAVGHPVEDDGAFSLQSGQATISIEADGQWRLVLSQEFPTIAPRPPLQATSIGSFVDRWILLSERPYTLEANYAGTGDFVVRLLKSDGSHTELVIDEIGSYAGEHMLNVQDDPLSMPPGLYALAVQADGVWSITITID